MPRILSAFSIASAVSAVSQHADIRNLNRPRYRRTIESRDRSLFFINRARTRRRARTHQPELARGPRPLPFVNHLETGCSLSAQRIDADQHAGLPRRVACAVPTKHGASGFTAVIPMRVRHLTLAVSCGPAGAPGGRSRRGAGRLTTVGLRPPSVSLPRRSSHPDCRCLLTLIVSRHACQRLMHRLGHQHPRYRQGATHFPANQKAARRSRFQ